MHSIAQPSTPMTLARQHFAPNRDITYSAGWDLHRVIHHRINNAGFYNPVDYRGDGALPTLAVVGDSYVEAMMVDYASTCAGRLADDLGDSGRVYTFGQKILQTRVDG